MPGIPKQLVSPLLRGALAHNGTAVLDILSPCVTFNNHAGSTKSYTWGKDNEEPIHILDFVPAMDQIEVEYEEGTDQDVQLHDGSWVRLRKLEREYDPTDRRVAQELIIEANEKNLFVTGLLYLDTSKRTFFDSLELCDEPLARCSDEGAASSASRSLGRSRRFVPVVTRAGPAAPSEGDSAWPHPVGSFLFAVPRAFRGWGPRWVSSRSSAAPVFAQRSFTIQDALGIASVSDPQLSPDGEFVVYVVSRIALEKNRSESRIHGVLVRRRRCRAADAGGAFGFPAAVQSGRVTARVPELR